MKQTKECIHCGSTFFRNPNEGRQRFKDRKFCSKRCSGLYRTTDTGFKECAFCGVMFDRGRMSKKQFVEKRCCSILCRRSLDEQNDEIHRYHNPKKCITCGSDYVRRVDEGKFEFSQRKTCSHECAVIATNTANTVPLAERFWNKVDIGSDASCWEWLGTINSNGYGTISVANGTESSHRVAWELANGSIPNGLLIRHLCHNPPCCNPKHLALGNAYQNAQDMVQSGRSLKGERATNSKLTEEQVLDIRARFDNGSLTSTYFSNLYGVAPNTVMSVIHRRTWTHI